MPHSRMDGEDMHRMSRREGGIKQKNSSDCSNELFSVPRTRLELARTNVHYPLKVACLPISPPGRHCRISHFGCANIELIFEIAKFSTDLCRKKDFFRAESAVEAFAGHIPEPRGSLPGPCPPLPAPISVPLPLSMPRRAPSAETAGPFPRRGENGPEVCAPGLVTSPPAVGRCRLSGRNPSRGRGSPRRRCGP